MADCSQLQLLLSDVQQDRAALDDPDTYCQDQCDPGDVECIKQCHESIPRKKAADDAAIARLQDEITTCEILLTTYTITVPGLELTGKLTISALDGTFTPITDTGFGFTGTLQYDQDPPGGTAIFGAWDEMHQRLTFTRIFSVDRFEDYAGGFGGFPPAGGGYSLAGGLSINGGSTSFWQANPVAS